MSIAPRLKGYLESRDIEYQLLHHTPTDTAHNAARSAHIPLQCMVKGVLLQDDNDEFVMAALGAARSLDLTTLNEITGRNLRLAPEEALEQVLDDCATGAVPALGEAYGLPTLWDEGLLLQPSFYLEAGDHEGLIRLGYFAFTELMAEDNCLALAINANQSAPQGINDQYRPYTCT